MEIFYFSSIGIILYFVYIIIINILYFVNLLKECVLCMLHIFSALYII